MSETQHEEERSPFRAADAEQSVLASVFLENDALDRVRRIVAPADFYVRSNGHVFAAMLDLASDGQPLDRITVQRWLVERGRLDEAHLLSLTNTIPTVANVEGHAEIVRRNAAARRAHDASVRAVGLYERGDFDAADRVLAVASSRAAVRPASKSPLEDCWRTIEELGTDEDWFAVEPPPPRLLLARDGANALVSGVVGLLIAPGSRGKTMANVSLAISVATGRPWLDAFQVVNRGPVVLALAEEDLGEVRRRIYATGRALGLTDAEQRDAARSIVAMGLAGRDVRIVDLVSGVVSRTAMHADLLARIEQLRPELVILDPLSRWAPQVESENAVATACIEALEELSQKTGSVVLVSHHTSKWSRREGGRGGASAARGVTALTDGPRWVASIEGENETDIKLAIVKNNRCPPMEPLALVRDPGTGVLRVPNSYDADLAKARALGVEQERRATVEASVVKVVAATPDMGTAKLRLAVRADLGKVGQADVDAAVARLLDAGRIEDRGGLAGHRYHVVGAAGGDA